MPRPTRGEISPLEQAQLLAEVGRAWYGYLLALHILLLRAAEKEGATEYSRRRCTLLSPSLKRSVLGILQSTPRLCGWWRTRWGGATVALELRVPRQITVSGETVRR